MVSYRRSCGKEGLQMVWTYSRVNSPPCEGSVQRRKIAERTYRQNPQKRCLSSILQTDHRNIHLRGPNPEDISIDQVVGETFSAEMIAQHVLRLTQQMGTYQNNLNSQSYTFLKIPAMMSGRRCKRWIVTQLIRSARLYWVLLCRKWKVDAVDAAAVRRTQIVAMQIFVQRYHPL